ncbi:MAG: hypothetical protein N3B18_09790 [Desulfobacterota bacterium]|nr:hypothetical protein [Thermodesulfobacteriota bacterium]
MPRTNSRQYFLLLLVAAAAFVVTGTACAGTTTRTFVVPHDDLRQSGATALAMSIDLYGATGTIIPTQDPIAVLRATVTYGDTEQEPALIAGVDNATFTVTMTSGSAAPNGSAVSQWDIRVSTVYTVPTDLTLSCSSSTLSADLGGLPLRSCVMVLQSSSLNADWRIPVQDRVQVLVVAARASSVLLNHLGNTNFEACGLICATSPVQCTFAGNFAAGDHSLTAIQIGAQADIVIPEQVGARITMHPLLSRIQVADNGWQQHRRLPFSTVYLTNDYSTQDITVTMDFTAIATQVSLMREPR